MKELTLKWIAKADSDYRIAQQAMHDQPSLTDAICFHAQQCAEKYAKAFLVEHGKPVEYTDSSLTSLYSECIVIEPELEAYKADFDRLDRFGIGILYPGRSSSDENVRPAVESMTRIRVFIRAKLGLDQPATPEGN